MTEESTLDILQEQRLFFSTESKLAVWFKTYAFQRLAGATEVWNYYFTSTTKFTNVYRYTHTFPYPQNILSLH